MVPVGTMTHSHSLCRPHNMETFRQAGGMQAPGKVLHIWGGVGIYRTAGLTAFPRALCSMQHLKSLEFRRQYFGHLPQEISKLTQLAHLSIA